VVAPESSIPASIGCLIFKEQIENDPLAARNEQQWVCFEGLPLCSAQKRRSILFCKKDDGTVRC
jgi:hypothetical protein